MEKLQEDALFSKGIKPISLFRYSVQNGNSLSIPRRRECPC
jgi:hypothetical protein